MSAVPENPSSGGNRAPKVIQFSPIRTGSTLCYAAIRLAAPNHSVIKAHSLSWAFWPHPVIVTVRNRYDSVVSSARRYQLELTDENIELQARELRAHGYAHLRWLHLFPRVKILRYEEFIDRLEELPKEVAAFLGTDVTDEISREFSETVRPDVVYQKTVGLQFETLIDPDTHLHGSHVSPSFGRPGEGRNLTEGQRRLVDAILGPRSFIY